MTRDQFIEDRAFLLKQKKAIEDKINEQYTAAVVAFITENSPVQISKVYTLKKNGVKRRGGDRIVIYSIEARFFGDAPFIEAGGWWLDHESVPLRWDSWVVYGASNSTVLEVAEDQTNHPVPQGRKK